jgi:hypothetical protein
MSRLKDKVMKFSVSRSAPRFIAAAAAAAVVLAAPHGARAQQVTALSTNGAQSASAPGIAPPPVPANYQTVAPPPSVAGGVAQVASGASNLGQGLAGYLPGQDQQPEQKIKYVYTGPGPLNGVELPTRLFNNIPPRFASVQDGTQ